MKPPDACALDALLSATDSIACGSCSLGADGVMVPLINTRQEAEQAVSFCRYPPEGVRSAAYPVR